ncbi:MAG: hypothetical protein M3Z92_05155 [Bacteroidota bacterium]|nr:hypothetical protein [Bacteroidota bacterium]
MKPLSNSKNLLFRSSPLHQLIYQRRLFSKYRSNLLVAVIALIAGFGFLITSCQKQGFRKECVPFKSKFETLGQDISPTVHQITGTGKGTPIGKSTFVGTVYLDSFPKVTGMTTFTAEGGQIFTTFSGSVEGPDKNGDVLVTNNNIITGGTGRFAGATGRFTTHGISNINVPTGSLTNDGTICFYK